jgi:hypothetical protein
MWGLLLLDAATMRTIPLPPRQARAGGAGVNIEVCDSRITTQAEHAGLIFEAFFRIGNPQSDLRKGLARVRPSAIALILVSNAPLMSNRALVAGAG